MAEKSYWFAGVLLTNEMIWYNTAKTFIVLLLVSAVNSKEKKT